MNSPTTMQFYFDNLDDKTFILMDAPTFAYHKEEQKNAKHFKAYALCII